MVRGSMVKQMLPLPARRGRAGEAQAMALVTRDNQDWASLGNWVMSKEDQTLRDGQLEEAV